jgi:rod shape-determining protein MreC
MAWRGARVALVVCLVLAAVLVLVDLRGGGPARAVRGVAGAVAGPPITALAWLRTEAGQRLGGSADERARIAALEQELEQSRSQAAAAAAGELSEADLRELAAGLPAEGYRRVAARVVALATPEDQVRSAAVSAGSADGVRPGQAVAAAGGLAGLVDSAARTVSTVRLLVDTGTALAARVASTGEAGVLRGTGDAARFELLDPLGSMSPGDLVVTLGTPDGMLPADLPLGRISRITGSAADLTRVAEVVPAVDDSTLDRVVVLVPGAAS